MAGRTAGRGRAPRCPDSVKPGVGEQARITEHRSAGRCLRLTRAGGQHQQAVVVAGVDVDGGGRLVYAAPPSRTSPAIRGGPAGCSPAHGPAPDRLQYRCWSCAAATDPGSIEDDVRPGAQAARRAERRSRSAMNGTTTVRPGPGGGVPRSTLTSRSRNSSASARVPPSAWRSGGRGLPPLDPPEPRRFRPARGSRGAASNAGRRSGCARASSAAADGSSGSGPARPGAS